jgi:hypothetical protein
MYFDGKAITKILDRGLEGIDSINITVQGSDCIISHSIHDDEEEIVFAKDESSNLVESLYYADNLSETINVKQKLYLGHIVFEEEFSSRYLSLNEGETFTLQDESIELVDENDDLINRSKLNCVNIIVNRNQSLISLSNYDEEDVIVKQFDSSALVDAIYFADEISSMLDAPLRLYLGHIVFKEEFSSRHYKDTNQMV